MVPWSSITAPGEIARAGDCIGANEGRWIPYRPLDEFDAPYLAYSAIREPADLLNFMNTFGPVTRAGFVPGVAGPMPAAKGDCVWGDDVAENLRRAALFRQLLPRQKKPRTLAQFFESELRAAEGRSHKEAYKRAKRARRKPIPADPTWVAIPPTFDLILDAQKGVQLKLTSPPPNIEKPEHYWLNIPIAELDVVADVNKGIQVRSKTDALISALRWQLAQRLSGNTMFRECRHCGSLFEVGPGTDRRTDAIFCCKEHSVRFHSLRHSVGG